MAIIRSTTTTPLLSISPSDFKYPTISDLCYVSLILICVSCFMLVMFVFIQQLKREGFCSSEVTDVQIMEQGLLVRKKKGKGRPEWQAWRWMFDWQ